MPATYEETSDEISENCYTCGETFAGCACDAEPEATYCNHCGEIERECWCGNNCRECDEPRDTTDSECLNCGYCDCYRCGGSYGHAAECELDPTRGARCSACNAIIPANLITVDAISEAIICNYCANTRGAASPVWSTRLGFTYGVEVEISQDCEHAGRVLSVLHNAGLVETESLHPYHCSCNTCADAAIAAQQDSTAAAEFVTRTLHSERSGDMAILNSLTQALVIGNADISGEVGAHCNIGFGVTYSHLEGITAWAPTHAPAMTSQQRTAHRLAYLLGAYATEWEKLAAQGQGYLRSYNGAPRYLSGAHKDAALLRTALNALDVLDAPQWLATFPTMAREQYSGTYAANADTGNLIKNKGNRWEFRLWNGTRAIWRAQMAVGISAAAVAWAESTLLLGDPAQGLLWEIHPFLDAPLHAAALAQLEGSAPNAARPSAGYAPNIG